MMPPERTPDVTVHSPARQREALCARLASVERAIASYDQGERTGVWPGGRRPPERTPGETRLGLIAMRDRTRAALRRLEAALGAT
jgi:hypothetical protein